MHTNTRPSSRLINAVIMLAWLVFFASSLSIAWQRPPQHDDALFATVSKNVLDGYGWSTNYGENIPFNPDLTAGPLLLISAMPLLALAGNAAWVPAMSGALLNIALVLLIFRQLHWRERHQQSNKSWQQQSLALLLTVSLFAANDFKTFTGYYSCTLLFVLSLLISLNPVYGISRRMLCLGGLAAASFYIKPLALLSFMLAIPLLLLVGHRGRPHTQQSSVGWPSVVWSTGRRLLLFFVGFMLVFASWQFYKQQELSVYSAEFREAHQAYGQTFFEYHGSGIGQLQDSTNKLEHLKNNAKKNWRILQRFYNNHFGIPPLYLFLAGLPALFFLYKKRWGHSASYELLALLAVVTLGHLFWFLVFSFSLSPGHAFFLNAFCTLFIFMLLLEAIPHRMLAVNACLFTTFLFPVAHMPALEAYSFRVDDPLINNQDIDEALAFSKTLDDTSVLASCGYNGAPWRLMYRRPGQQPILDCHHLLEDALISNNNALSLEHATARWSSELPVTHFVLVIEGFGLLTAAKEQGLILGPLLQQCQQHILFRNRAYGFCTIDVARWLSLMDAQQVAAALPGYQSWYRTRLK